MASAYDIYDRLGPSSVNDVFGQIGAAKAFSSSVAYNLNLDIKSNESEIEELNKQLEIAKKNEDSAEQKRISKKIKRLKRNNKMNSVSYKVTNGTTDFLTKLCSYLDIGVSYIIKWLSYVIINVLPELEIAVKMLILTNIKKMVSCAIDPRIPDEWRRVGVLLNEATVDPRGILQSSPYSEWGRYNYFGIFSDTKKSPDKAKPTFELARAEDMNAFLWFAKNCAYFVSPNIVGDNLFTYFNVPSGTKLGDMQIYEGRNNYRFVEGSTFKYSIDSSETYLCTKREFVGGKTYYTIVPVSSTRDTSGIVHRNVTWYKDRTSFVGIKTGKEINYKKSKPLFTIEYLGENSPAPLSPYGNFRFKILPKPFSTAGGFIVNLGNNLNTLSDMINTPAEEIVEVVGSEIVSMPQYKFQGIQSPFPYKAKFNADGIYDKRGRYSIDTYIYDVVEEVGTNASNSPVRYFSIKNGSQTTAYLRFNRKEKTFTITEDKNESNPEQDTVLSGSSVSHIITECYGGDTVYEFNYDYVVSMILFDEQEIAADIVKALMDIHIPNPFKKDKKTVTSDRDRISDTDQIRIDTYIDKLIEKMINTEEGEFTNCFYSFDNKDYEEMEQTVANKIMNSTLSSDNSDDSIQSIFNIIDAYDANGTLESKTETISLALTKAANACGFRDVETTVGGSSDTEGSSTVSNLTYDTESSEKKSVEFFIKRAVQLLTSAIVNAILTPKVLMLLQVNRMMMGTYAFPTDEEDFKERYKYDVEEILNGLSGLLTGIIRNVIDTIHKELLKMILERLSELTASFMRKLGMEYATKWYLLLKQLLACFKRNKNKMEGSGVYGSEYTDVINNIIDQVDYADIDTLVDEIMPNTNPC